MKRCREKCVLGACAVVSLWAIVACNRSGDAEAKKQKLADYVDLERFMGTWYVHGYTPIFLDRGATQATETYVLDADGKIQTTYRFRKGKDGSIKTYHPVGWVHDKKTNAEWRMRFFGLFTSPYYILYVSDDYEQTVVGHPGRKLSWIMSRSPEMDENTYQRLAKELSNRGYDMDRIERMSH